MVISYIMSKQAVGIFHEFYVKISMRVLLFLSVLLNWMRQSITLSVSGLVYSIRYIFFYRKVAMFSKQYRL